MFANGREGRGTLKTLLLDVLIVFESMEVCTWKYTIIPQVLVLLPDGFMCVCVCVCVPGPGPGGPGPRQGGSG
jgi:hypothetical protein